MPAATTSTVSAKGKDVSSAKSQLGKKTRSVRRRGRAAGMESDEEIEREVGSDSDSDAHSSAGSDEDDGSDREDPDATRVVTPSTTQSPPPPEGDELKPGQGQAAAGPFQQASADWSDMVADEDANGASDLPVIDFADLGKDPADGAASHAAPAESSASLASGDTAGEKESGDAAGPSQPVDGGSAPRRPYGQNARLAYQERLEKDPSYVPVIGQFWGHDDRLLDKEVRPLSTWWRARGFPRGGFRGRGRGGFFGPGRPLDQTAPDGSGEPVEAAPVDKPWTHDGFEEMKRRDEQRRQFQDGDRGGFRGGRGGGPGRGRGGAMRGGFIAHPPHSPLSPAPTSTDPPPVTGSTLKRSQPLVSVEPRIWYAMKPERIFTKQHDGFLFFDFSLKPRPGMGPGFKVRFPGNEGFIVRGPHQSLRPNASAASRAKARNQDAPLFVVVRLPETPKPKVADTQMEPSVAPAQSLATMDTEDSVEIIMDPAVGASLRAQTASESAAPVSVDAQASTSTTDFVEKPKATPPIQVNLPSRSHVPEIDSQAALESQPAQQHVNASMGAATEVQMDTGAMPVPAPSMHAGAPVFSPSAQQTQPSPTYGSSYIPSLPPGIALSQHGVPYEVATGRPVFIPSMAPPPPPAVPQQIFTPPPGMHGPSSAGHAAPPMPFVPGHLHHHPSLSLGATPPPEFFAPRARPPAITSVLDPATGLPIFTPARQSSRIQIRAPNGQIASPADTMSPAQASALRVSIGPPAETALAPPVDLNAPPPLSAVDLQAHQFAMSAPPQPPVQPVYAPYPQQPQYYYPGYQPYMGHHQMPSYDMYAPPEHMPPQQTVYYHH